MRRYAQGNGLWTLDGLDQAPYLHTLNVESNCLETLECLSATPELESLCGGHAVIC